MPLTEVGYDHVMDMTLRSIGRGILTGVMAFSIGLSPGAFGLEESNETGKATDAHGQGTSSQTPISSDSALLGLPALTALAESTPPQMTAIGDPTVRDGLRRAVYQFENDGLLQFALMLEPLADAPEAGWPVLLYCHGFHPDPPNYGRRTSDGVTDRPGDYYRGVPEAYARAGYRVVVPDYRGHNDSEGASFTKRQLATFWYVRDAISALAATAELPGSDEQQLFITGHSMGGQIALRAAVAFGEQVSAVSIWSTSGDDPLTYVFSLDFEESAAESAAASVSDERAAQIAALSMAQESESSAQRTAKLRDEAQGASSVGTEPAASPATGLPKTLPYLDRLRTPLMLRHARGDQTTSYWNSMAIAARLEFAKRPYELSLEEGSDHLFKGNTLSNAMRDDLRWFAAAAAKGK